MSELFTDSHDRAPIEGAREPPFDSMESSLPILFDPYEYISKRCKDNGQKVFQTRLLLERVICVSGPEAAKVFYDNSRMNRKDVVPGFIRKTLFGEGGVQGLDDADHKHRKQMFMGLMSPERIKRLAEMTEALLLEHAAKWSTMTEVNFYTAVQEVLTRSSCAWAGVPLQEIEVQQRSVEISALFDSAASVGWRNLWSRYSRYKVEQWISGIIEAVRNQEIRPAEDTALYQIAFHRELNGDLLDLKIASVELVNVIRPIVAISVYLVHVAHALHVHPECKEKLNEDVFDKNKLYSEWFVQEVRRDYPFFPILIARVKHDFTWSGYQFPKDRLVVLDLYGTNHDSATWEAPYEFRPERFRTWDKSPFNFIPQGGGSHQENHRCPGEWITIELMKVTARLIASGRIEYTVPEQDLALDLTRLPAIPRDQFHIMDVKVNNPVKAEPTEPIYDAAAVKATSTVTKASEEKRGEGYVQEQAYQA